MPHLSVVVPAFNEQGNLGLLHQRLSAALSACTDSYEILFIDDGSRDGTLDVIRGLATHDPRVRFLSFSRNFGHEIATTAGLDHAAGDAVILIDADLQDPPELIPEMVKKWREGAAVVYARRRHRPGESAFKRTSAYLFYRLINRLSDTAIPHDTGDYRLMDRRVVEAVKSCRENPRFIRGLVSWVGFRQEAVLYDRDERHAGKTNYGFFKLLRLALEAISAFSLKPLKLTAWLGVATIALSVVLSIVIVIQRLFFKTNMLEGYAFLACSIFFLGGVQLTMLGILAHYLGSVFTHSLNRPLYIVAEQDGGHAGNTPTPSIRTPATSKPAREPRPLQPAATEPKIGRFALPGDGPAREELLVVRGQAPHHPSAD